MNTIKEKLQGKSLLVGSYLTSIDIEIYETSGREAILFILPNIGEMYGVLTTNMSEVELEENEILVKTYPENVELANACRKTGWFIDTGKRIHSGFVDIEIWKVI